LHTSSLGKNGTKVLVSEEQQGNMNIQNKRMCEAQQGNTEFKLVYKNNTKNKIIFIFSVINEQANFFDRQLHIRKFLVSSTDPKYHVNYCHQFVPEILIVPGGLTLVFLWWSPCCSSF
jgi:hypothetical protein